jgi:putative DNA primase/helicase
MADPREGFDPDEEAPWEASTSIAYRSAADITPQRTRWLWPGHLPAGAFVLLNGRQGDGKGTIGASFISRLTTGSPLPDGFRPDPVNCAVLSLEDDSEQTVVPRLKAAGADLSRVSILDGVNARDEEGNPIRRSWRMPMDLAILKDLIVKEQIAFLVLDPVAYMIGGADGNAYSEIGAILIALRQVAEETACTILGVRHLRKSSASDARDAGIGSVAWTAVARVEFIVGRDPQDESGRLRVLAQSKNNLSPEAGSLAYTIDEDDEWKVGVVRWEGASLVGARNLTAEGEAPDALADRLDARELLRVVLADGPVASKQIIADAREAGIGERTLRKAKADLGVKSTKAGLGGGWTWSLPEVCTEGDHRPLAVAALQGCSLPSEQDLFNGHTETEAEGCNTAGTNGAVQSSGSAFYNRDDF